VISKQQLLDAVRAQVAAEVDAAVAAQKKTQAGAVHPEARQEGSKDTRAIEAGYLARGLARRAEELQEAQARLARVRVRAFGEDDAIDLTALVTVEDAEGVEAVYLLLPAAAGRRVEAGSVTVSVVTPQARLGRALLGRALDDDVTVTTPRGPRDLTITAVA